MPSYSNPTTPPQGAQAGFGTYPAPTVDVDNCDGEGEHPQLILGNPTSDRAQPDGASAIQFVDKTLVFRSNGNVRSWDIYVGRPGDGFMQVWRPMVMNGAGTALRRCRLTGANPEDCSTATNWRLHCSLAFTATTHGPVHIPVPVEQRCNAAKGDAIGWSHTGQGVIDFDSGQGATPRQPGIEDPTGALGNEVLWHYGGAAGGQFDGATLGQDIAFDGGADAGQGTRIYSVAATVSYAIQRETCAPVESMKTCAELNAEAQGNGQIAWIVDVDDAPTNALGPTHARESRRVCGASQDGVHLDCDSGTFAEAIHMCFAAGARLCTMAEISHDETHLSGCNFDTQRVWSSTRSGCPEGQVNTLAGASGALSQFPQECTAITETHPVRCCADVTELCADGTPCHPSASLLTCGELSWDETQGFGGASVCAESDGWPEGCTNDVTFEQAANICLGGGARLCTVAEILAHETRNTGCMFNYEYIWTSEQDECQSNQVTTMTGSQTLRIMPGNTYPPAPPICEDILTGTAAVSCCADASTQCGSHDPESCRDIIVAMWGMCDRGSCGGTCQEAVRTAAFATGCFAGTCAFDTHEWAVEQMAQTCQMDDVTLQPCTAGPVLDYDHTEVAYWPFDDGTADDLVGGHDGRMTGGVTSTFDQERGYVMEFDGNEGTYIEVPNSDVFDLTEFSFFAWMKREDVAAIGVNDVGANDPHGNGVLLSHGQGFGEGSTLYDCSRPIGAVDSAGGVCCPDSCHGCGGSKCSRRPGGSSQCCTSDISTNGVTCGENGGAPPCNMPAPVSGAANDKLQYQFQLHQNHVRVNMEAVDGTFHNIDGATQIQPGVWTHVGFTLNRGFRAASYINGARDSAPNARLPRFQIPGLDHIITIGAKTILTGTGGHEYVNNFQGALDDVRLFNSAVAPRFVTALYNQIVADAATLGATGQCDQNQALARLASLIQYCCDEENEVCATVNGVEQPPDSCSASCAAMYLPWFEDCQHVIGALFDEQGAHANLGGAFTEQIVLAPWRIFYGVCEVHSGGTGSATAPNTAPTSCDMTAINAACADQTQLANQQTSVLCQTPCVTTITANYDDCQRDMSADAEFINNLEPLMQLCAGDITTRRCYDKFTSFEASFPQSCCPLGVCPSVDPATGGAFFLPNRCTASCAHIFMPLFSECAETLWGQQPAQFSQAVTFEETCATREGRFVGTDGFDPCHGIPCGQCNDRNDDTGSGFGFECGWCSHNGGFCSSICTTEAGACVAVDPNAPDSCPSIDNCVECTGDCGWCEEDGVGVCSRECTTSNNECAFEGCNHGQWKVEYFNNNNLQGTPEEIVCAGNGPTVSHEWGAAGVQRLAGVTDQFSVRWTGSFAFSPGTTKWTDRSDDGSRLYIDGQLVMDHWSECCATWKSDPIAMLEGNHEVIYEFQEDAGQAYAHLHSTCSCRRCFWEKPQITTHTRAGDNSGTHCNILITLIGATGHTDEMLLRSGMADGRAQTSTVDFCDIGCAMRIGDITHIQLRTDCSDGWKWDSVDVYMPTFKKYTFGSIDDARTGQNFAQTVNSLDIEEHDGVASIRVAATGAAPPNAGAIRITFEPPDTPTPSGYEKDSGQLFGPQPVHNIPGSTSLNYGWNCDLNADGNDFRDRELFADQVLDTLVVLDREGTCPDPVVWEIEIPNGEYTVTVGYSDPAYSVITDGCMLEGVSASVGTVGQASPSEFTAAVTLTDGRLTFQGKYSGVAAVCQDIAYLIITPGTDNMGPNHCEFPRCAVGSYEANYWNNVDLHGRYSAAACETGPDISFDWGYDQGPQQLADVHAAINTHITVGVSDQFSARWEGMFEFPSRGSPGPAYQFSVRSDDGSRLWFDDKMMMDHWHDCCQTWLTDPVTVHTHFPSHPTQHKVLLEMQEDGGNAYVSLSWTEVPSPCENGWYAYDGMCWYLGSNHVGWGDDQCPPGSNLASLHDEDHLRFARGIGNDCIASGDEVDNRYCRMWVGLSDATTECGASWDCTGWEWTDGSPYDYTFWGPGQPNDDEYGTYAQDCGYLNPDYNWLIGDEDCGTDPAHQWRSLCQKPYLESLSIAGFALWDQWCNAQTDAQQDNAMDNACGTRYAGSRAASTEEIIALLGGQTMSAHPTMVAEHAGAADGSWSSYPGLTYECLMGTCANGECHNVPYAGNQCLDSECRVCTAGGEGVINADASQWDPACGSWDATGRRGALCVITGSGGGGH